MNIISAEKINHYKLWVEIESDELPRGVHYIGAEIEYSIVSIEKDYWDYSTTSHYTEIVGSCILIAEIKASYYHSDIGELGYANLTDYEETEIEDELNQMYRSGELS